MAGVMFVRTDGGNHRTVARSLLLGRSGMVTRRMRQQAVCAVSAVAVALPVGVAGTVAAQAATAAPHTVAGSWTPLTLQKGWTSAPFGTSVPAVRTISGIIYLKGAIATTGTNPVPFTLPTEFRPARAVFVPVDLCNATHGYCRSSPPGW